MLLVWTNIVVRERIYITGHQRRRDVAAIKKRKKGRALLYNIQCMLGVCPHTTKTHIYYWDGATWPQLKKGKNALCVSDTTIYVRYVLLCVCILYFIEGDLQSIYAIYMCPHTTIYVSSYYYICVLILLDTRRRAALPV
jgi:hypothetical protein